MAKNLKKNTPESSEVALLMEAVKLLTSKIEILEQNKNRPLVKNSTSEFTGKLLRILPTGKTWINGGYANPRREGSFGHRSFQLLIEHGGVLKYEEYVALHGRNNDLRWDVERGWAEVITSEQLRAETEAAAAKTAAE